MKDVACFTIDDDSAASEARRRAAAVATALGLGAEATGRVSIVTAELASNMLKHAGGGLLLLRTVQCEGEAGVEILALDTGPGIRDLQGSLRDGYSTAGSQGTGLGAVRRLSALFDAYAPPGAGTAILSRIWSNPPRASLPPRALTVGAVCVPVSGETSCGDAWAVHQTADRAAFLIADGLGHGDGAAVAAAEAVAAFRREPLGSPAVTLAAVDAALRRTRGAAAAVAEVLPRDRAVHYAAIGNITTRVHGGESARTLLSDDGTAGMARRAPRQDTYPWPGDAMLIAFSDGLTSRWNMSDHPGLHHRHPSLIAGVLFRDHRRTRDDAIVLVAVPRRTGS